jgi:SAM-dependent methyltransferase
VPFQLQDLTTPTGQQGCSRLSALQATSTPHKLCRTACHMASAASLNTELPDPICSIGRPSRMTVNPRDSGGSGGHAVGMQSDRSGAPMDQRWSWDPTLYAGSAGYYAIGRAAYPAQVADELVAVLDLDGSGRLLDVGCGPGSLTLLLAPHFAEAIGVDADAEMLTEAARLAEGRHVYNVSWRHLRAEDLPADLPSMRLVTFAQSFHWMDRPRVAAAARDMLVAGGAVVHVHATTHQGIESDVKLPHPRPPREAITQLVQRYLGPRRRAGQGVLSPGTPGGEDAIYRAAGFTGPQRIEVPGWIIERTTEEVAASVYSLSGSAPHLFGDRLDRFDAELRTLLGEASATGWFSEQMRSVALDIWR